MYYDDEFNADNICAQIIEEIDHIVGDYLFNYHKEWADSGAEVIAPYLEELGNTEFTDTVETIMTYADDTYNSDLRGAHNKAKGIRLSLIGALEKIYRYLDRNYPTITDEDINNDEDGFITDEDIEASNRKAVVHKNLEYVKGINLK